MVRRIQLDFTDVKDQSLFNKSRIPAGDYLAKVTKVEDAEVKSSGEFQWLFTIKLIEKHPTSSFPYYCQIGEKSLWKVRNLLVAAGINVPKRKVTIDPSKVVGRTIAVTVQDTEYDGKLQSEIGGAYPASELVGDPDEGASTTADDDDDDETEQVDEETEEESEEEAEAGDQFEDMDRAALKAFTKEHDAEFKVFKSTTDDDLRTKARSIAVPLDEEEPEDADEEEDEEDELPPPPKKTAKPATKRPAARRTTKPVDDEDLDIEDM